MISKTEYNFRSFKELQAEKVRLEASIAEQQDSLLNDVIEIKNKFTPVNLALSFLRPNKENSVANSLVSNGVGFLTNAIIGKHTGLIGKLLIPFVTSNLASRAIENPQPLVNIAKGLWNVFRNKKDDKKEN